MLRSKRKKYAINEHRRHGQQQKYHHVMPNGTNKPYRSLGDPAQVEPCSDPVTADCDHEDCKPVLDHVDRSTSLSPRTAEESNDNVYVESSDISREHQYILQDMNNDLVISEDHRYHIQEVDSDAAIPEDDHYYVYEADSDSESDCDISIQGEEIFVESTSFLHFAAEVKHCVQDRNYLFKESEKDIQLFKLYEHGDSPSVMLSVKIDLDFNCSLFVHQKPLEQSHSIWNDMPAVFNNADSVMKLLDKIDLLTVCCGNPELDFQDLAPIGSILTNNIDTGMAAYREGDFGAISSSGVVYSSSIRSANCVLLTQRSLKCNKCTRYGYALRKRLKRLSERMSSNRTFSHSSFKHNDMTRSELYQKLSEQKLEMDTLRQTVAKLQRQADKAKRAEIELAQEKEQQEAAAFPNCSPRQKLFWEQQQRYWKYTDKRGMRWHPMIIRWCLYIKRKSEKLYEAIRESGFISLPSVRNLQAQASKLGYEDAHQAELDLEKILEPDLELSSANLGIDVELNNYQHA